MANELPGPKTVIVKNIPASSQVGEITSIGKLYDVAGQMCDVNSEFSYGRQWSRIPFLVRTANGLFYGRPSLRVRDKDQKIVMDSGIIINIGRAQQGEMNPAALRVALPGKLLDVLRVGGTFPYAEKAGAIRRILTISPEDQLGSAEALNYPWDPELLDVEADLRLHKVAETAWELGTRCLRALGEDDA